MPHICVKIKIISHNVLVSFQKPLNQRSVEIFTILTIFMRIFSTSINSKVLKEKGLEIILTNKRLCTLKRDRNSKTFFLKTNVEINNNLKVIYLEFSYYRI